MDATTWYVIFGSVTALIIAGWARAYENHQAFKRNLKKVLAERVADGTVTQEHADAFYWAATERKS